MKRVLLVVLVLTLSLGFSTAALAQPGSGTPQKTVAVGYAVEGWVYPLPLEEWQWGYQAIGSMSATYTMQPKAADVNISFILPGQRTSVRAKLVEFIDLFEWEEGQMWIVGYWDVYVNGKLFLDNAQSAISLWPEGWKIHIWDGGVDKFHVWGHYRP
jgi:hypothetical protein